MLKTNRYKLVKVSVIGEVVSLVVGRGGKFKSRLLFCVYGLWAPVV